MTKTHVLIADDDPSLNLVIAETFRAAGYRVTAVADGEEALRALADDPADAVVLDVGMPGRNGFEICRELRARDESKTLPLVLLTARSADADRHWGLDAGADEYLTKPFDPNALIATVSGLVESRLRGDERNPITKLPDLSSVLHRAREFERARVPAMVAVIEFAAESALIHRQKYGDLRSAEALRVAATCLRQALAGAAVEGDIPVPIALGHAGDVSYSRFVLAGPARLLRLAIERARMLFAHEAPGLYNDVDRGRGYVAVRGPMGDGRQVPLLNLVADFVPLAVLEAEIQEAEIQEASRRAA